MQPILAAPNRLRLVKKAFTFAIAAVAVVAAISLLKSEEHQEEDWKPVEPS